MVNEKIPSDWEQNNLEDVCDFLDGMRKPVKKSDREKMRGNIPYYGASGVIDWVNDFIFNEPLICVGEDGENLRSRVLPIAFKINGKTWVNNHAHVLRPKQNANIDYLTYYLNSIDYEEYITGSAQPKLNQSVCRKISVLRPPLPEQRKIAAILTSVDDAITATQRIIDQTEVVKRGLMQQLLTKGIGHTTFKQTEIGEIPNEWDIVTLPNVSFFQEGPGLRTWQFKTEGTKVINVTNLVGGTLDLSKTNRYIDTQEVESKYAHFLIDAGDIVVASSGNSWGKVSVVSEEHLPLLMNTSVIRFKSLDVKVLNKQYLLYFLQSTVFFEQIKMMITGSAQPNFGPTHLKKTLIALPPIHEQTAIVSSLDALEAKSNNEKAIIANLHTIKRGIMQVLLTGKVRVNINEPSEVTIV